MELFLTYNKKVQLVDFLHMLLWQGRQDLNLRHPVLETGALPTELLPCTSRVPEYYTRFYDKTATFARLRA